MTDYTVLVQQLPQRLQAEIATHLGAIAGMSEVQIVTRYKDVAESLRSGKLATLPPGYDPQTGLMTAQEFDQFGDPVGVSPELAEMMHQFIAYHSAWHLGQFVQQLLAVINQLQEADRQLAQRQAEEAARQLAQAQAEEAARQLAQSQAEEQARILAQHQAEEAARQLALRQAEEAAQLAARELAAQQAEAAAQALAAHKAEEAAQKEARLAIELAVVAVQPAGASSETEDTLTPSNQESGGIRTISFIPGPEATTAIEGATLVLKRNIDEAVAQYASAITPYLNTLHSAPPTAR